MIEKFLAEYSQPYRRVSPLYSRETRTLQFHMTDPYFTPSMVDDLLALIEGIRPYTLERDGDGLVIEYVLFRSVHEDFSYGGDLSFFVDATAAYLQAYSDKCVRLIHMYHHLPAVTISVVSGKMLGAGFEAALASDLMLACEGTEASFPEAAFGMYPGHGGVLFLRRALTPAVVASMVQGRRTLSYAELVDTGLAIPTGSRDMRGVSGILNGMRSRPLNTKRSLLIQPKVSGPDLKALADGWVQSNRLLTDRQRRAMKVIAKRQARKLK